MNQNQTDSENQDANLKPNKAKVASWTQHSNTKKPAAESNAGAKTKTVESKVDSWIQSWNPHKDENLKNQSLEPVMIAESVVRKKAARWFFVAFGIFLIWAFYAPIDAGVTASGQVVVSGYRKAVQHPTGGVVREILINEGDHVTKDQVLIKVNPLKEQANLNAIESEYINVLVNEARLKAERISAGSITWPKELNKLRNQAQVKESKLTQELLFNARKRELQQTVAARGEQEKSLIEEEKNLLQLAEEGYVPRANAAQAMRNRLELATTLNTFKANFLKQLETELSDMQKRHESLVAQLESAKFDQEHADIKSPISGTIVGLKVYTVGGVITSGQMLAEVVPDDSLLVVDVKLPANVIDRVKPNAIVDMHFTAFNAVTTPTVPGIVRKVAVDKVMPDKTKPGEPEFEYYPVQVETTPEGLAMLGTLNIQPGMPVDVVIVTGQRSFMSYLMKPISDRVIWAFKN